jgi:two-component system, cell cycle response regulator DivK
LKVARILIAEDDPASLELVRVYLESKGYEVACANDGNRALELSESGEFDLVILDIHLPLYEGVEVLQMLRKRFIHHPIKIIALTADTGSELRDELVREGIDGYLTKPVSLAKLGEEITRLLST